MKGWNIDETGLAVYAYPTDSGWCIYAFEHGGTELQYRARSGSQASQSTNHPQTVQTCLGISERRRTPAMYLERRGEVCRIGRVTFTGFNGISMSPQLLPVYFSLRFGGTRMIFSRLNREVVANTCQQ